MFRVVLASLQEVDVPQATAYEVEADGSLRLECDGRTCAAFSGGEWVTVEVIGEKLAPDWPPDGLASLLLELRVLLGVRWGHDVHTMPEVADLSSGAFNDTERFLDAVLRSVGAEGDPELRGRRHRRAPRRSLVSRSAGSLIAARPLDGLSPSAGLDPRRIVTSGAVAPTGSRA